VLLLNWTKTGMVIGSALACMLACGCAAENENKTGEEAAVATTLAPATTPGVTDIAPAPLPAGYAAPAAPAYAAGPQPIIYDTTPSAAAPAPAAPLATPAGAGGSYTVRKGDTLWKIATAQYGNGNQWQRIAAANPGLSPTTLKVGQTIAIP
jgi:5'-nucleotidase